MDSHGGNQYLKANEFRLAQRLSVCGHRPDLTEHIVKLSSLLRQINIALEPHAREHLAIEV